MTQDSDEKTFDPLIPVPLHHRAFAFRDIFALWFSLGIGLLVLQAGALLVPGLSLWEAFGAILIGSVLGVGLLAVAGVIGTDTGLAAMGTLRPALGVRGASVPAVLNVVQLIGWGAFEVGVMRDAADALSRQTFGVSSPLLWTLLFGALATALAVAGPLAFVRRFLRSWGLWLLLAGAAWLTWSMLARHDLAALFARAGSGDLSFGEGIDLVAAMPLSWLPLIADYTRFGRHPGSMFRGSALGYLIGTVWFYGLGAAYALASGGGDTLLLSALASTGGGMALLLVLIDETDNAFADIYSAAVSTCTVLPGRSDRLSLVYGALCTLIALLVPQAGYENFLLLIGSVFSPLFGVLLADHFLVRRRQLEVDSLTRPHGRYWFTGGWHLKGLLAWAIGIAAYQGINTVLPTLGATIPSLALAAVCYLGLVAGRRLPVAGISKPR
jgi:NCS1 family nucleobase:cation symporter-1